MLRHANNTKIIHLKLIELASKVIVIGLRL